MRFMLFIYPPTPGDESYEPTAENVEAMTKYNESLTKAGVLLALDGLLPISRGARITFEGGKPNVTDGPYTEAKEVVGGYWLIDVKSKEEAVEWASRIPGAEGDIVEVRQVAEMSDFSDEVQAVDMSGVKPSQQ